MIKSFVNANENNYFCNICNTKRQSNFDIARKPSTTVNDIQNLFPKKYITSVSCTRITFSPLEGRNVMFAQTALLRFDFQFHLHFFNTENIPTVLRGS